MPAGLAETQFLAEERGAGRELGDHVLAACFMAETEIACFALAEGGLVVAQGDAASWRELGPPSGAVLCLAPDIRPGGVVVGCDDGVLHRLGPDLSPEELGRFGRRWVEQVATWGAGRDGLIACSVGRDLHLLGADGAVRRSFAHPSTVTGVAFDSRGKRVAASHYNGASLWFAGSKDGAARVLEWKGSHTGVAIHPAGDAVVTAMQENALHGWRLADGQHMRMSGYPAKPRTVGFSRSGRWLASSGADAVVLWPFFGGGPMGKAPTELAPGEAICTRAACHPKQEMVAAGFADGLVVLADIASGRVLPVLEAGRGEVTALAWSSGGATLAVGTETGFALTVNLATRAG